MGAAARHRQARRLEPHPRQAVPADRRRVRRVRRHPVYTAEILAAVPAFAPLAADAAAHHERLDGRGYPRASPAPRSPRNARILAVADVFEALTADRPYRGPDALGEALDIMRRDVGTAFCPHAFGALEAALADPGLALAA